LLFGSVFPDEDALAFYSFQKKLLSSKGELNSLCHRAMELLGAQEAVDDKTMRSWFRSLFLVVFREHDDAVFYLDALFAFDREGAFQSFLCATAVALVKLNLRPEVSSEFKTTSSVAEVIR